VVIHLFLHEGLECGSLELERRALLARAQGRSLLFRTWLLRGAICWSS